MLSAPRQLLHKGVRAVETMTASFLTLLIEPPAFLGEFDEQRRGFPRGALIAFLKGFY
jgi:hypothetical protein